MKTVFLIAATAAAMIVALCSVWIACIFWLIYGM